LFFVHADHLARPQKITDAAKSVVWDGQFAPFGEVHAITGSIVNSLMFPGQVYDSETGLTQNWHRDYDANVGRYLQSDPIGLDGGINTYAYVGGNPVARVDPDGRFVRPIPPAILEPYLRPNIAPYSRPYGPQPFLFPDPNDCRQKCLDEYERMSDWCDSNFKKGSRAHQACHALAGDNQDRCNKGLPSKPWPYDELFRPPPWYPGGPFDIIALL
jgi:RHS repeat-associated protein